MNSERYGRGVILRYYLRTCLEGLRKITKTSVRIAGLLDETSWIRSRSVNHSTTTFSKKKVTMRRKIKARRNAGWKERKNWQNNHPECFNRLWCHQTSNWIWASTIKFDSRASMSRLCLWPRNILPNPTVKYLTFEATISATVTNTIVTNDLYNI
jgi:hypothetical protein